MLLHTKELKNLSAAEQKFLLKSAKDGRLKSGAVDLTKIYTEGRRLIGKRSSSIHFSFYVSTFCHSIVFVLLIFYFLKIENF